MAYRFGRKSFCFSPVNMYYAERELGYTPEDLYEHEVMWVGYTYKYKMADIISREEGLPYHLVYATVLKTRTRFAHDPWLHNLLINNPDVVFIVALKDRVVLKRFPVEEKWRKLEVERQ